jgi:mono/diheme cytochrome c family protein
MTDRLSGGLLMTLFKLWTSFLAITSIFLSLTSLTAAQDDDAEYEALIESGKKVYEVRCLLCHGSEGNGKGPAGVIRRVEKNGRMLEIYPRDLTMAVFRFRTTPTGCLPDDKDLLDIITNGVPRSFMPSHKEELSNEEKDGLIEYIKTFSFRWEEEDPCDPIGVSKPEWVGSAQSIDKGRIKYKEMKCGECHGYEGKGDGPKSNDLKDDWGKQILPFNFATGDLKRGSTPENVYITFTTGLDGTGMPSYEDSLNEDDRWHLVSYTLKLMKKVTE